MNGWREERPRFPPTPTILELLRKCALCRFRDESIVATPPIRLTEHLSSCSSPRTRPTRWHGSTPAAPHSAFLLFEVAETFVPPMASRTTQADCPRIRACECR